jgi:hypothetical protein
MNSLTSLFPYAVENQTQVKGGRGLQLHRLFTSVTDSEITAAEVKNSPERKLGSDILFVKNRKIGIFSAYSLFFS